MSFLGSLSGVNAALQSTTALVREIRRPRLESKDFAALLQAQMQQASAMAKGNASTQTESQARQFLSLRDVNANGRLSFEESGLSQESFDALDGDRDGLLSIDELLDGARAGRLPTTTAGG